MSVRCSPQRLQGFKKLSENKTLRRDNKTRWNSWYTMIEWALKPDLRRAIDEFCANDPGLQMDRLLYEDWQILLQICDFLRPFEHATKATEGHNATVDEVLQTMDFLLTQFEIGRNKYPSNEYMAPCIDMGWAKLNKYYTRTEQSPIYVASIVLHPGWKWSYFSEHSGWKAAWIKVAETKVDNLWKDHYKSSFSSANSHPERERKAPTNEFRAWIQRKPIIVDDEYKLYLSEPVLSDVAMEQLHHNPLQWWLEPTQRTRFPALSKMAIDVLSIPAMSAEAERLFSSAKLDVTDQRNSLSIQTLEVLQCLKSWCKSDAVKPSKTA
jgi:hypothetical protein